MPRRFDTAFMTPPSAGTADPALRATLRRWCEAEAFGPAPRRLALGRAAPHPGWDDAALALDGSHALARLSRLRGLAWRLVLLLREHQPGHRPRPQDPWDCGWWREGALSAAAAFRPRRPTLLLLRGPAPAALLGALQAASAAYARPLRVLCLDPACAAPNIEPLPWPGEPA